MCTTAFPLQLFLFILYSFSAPPPPPHFLLRHTIANPSPPNHFHTFNSLMLSVSPTSRSFFQTVSWYLRLSFPLSSTILSLFCFLFLIVFMSPSLTHIQHGTFRNLPFFPSLSFFHSTCSRSCTLIPPLLQNFPVKWIFLTLSLQDVFWRQSKISHQLLHWHISASLPLAMQPNSLRVHNGVYILADCKDGGC